MKKSEYMKLVLLSESERYCFWGYCTGGACLE